MTAAVFEESGNHRTSSRGPLDQLADQPTSTLSLVTVVVLLVVVGQLTSTLLLASVVAALYAIGMARLLIQRRASLSQTVAIGLIHLGIAMLVAGTV